MVDQCSGNEPFSELADGICQCDGAIAADFVGIFSWFGKGDDCAFAP